MKVKVEINNQSSRAVKPKFILYEKISFFAQGRRRLNTNNILKEKMKPIAPSSRETATQVISIPPELPSSNLNCSIIKVEYRLKVNHCFCFFVNGFSHCFSMWHCWQKPPQKQVHPVYPYSIRPSSNVFFKFYKCIQKVSCCTSFFFRLLFPCFVFFTIFLISKIPGKNVHCVKITQLANI